MNKEDLLKALTKKNEEVIRNRKYKLIVKEILSCIETSNKLPFGGTLDGINSTHNGIMMLVKGVFNVDLEATKTETALAIEYTYNYEGKELLSWGGKKKENE